MTDGFGSITWWGFSPSIDLQCKDVNVALEKMKLQDENQDVYNVLLVGAGDIRHVLKTLAQTYKHPTRTMNFYILETSLELYARDLLLLSIALEKPARMGLQEKTELFLEIFGNTYVRRQSMDYVEKMCLDFIKMVTDFDYLEKKMPLIDMSLLKFKERDMLEGIFKFWKTADKKAFDIETSWDLRLRKYLGTRYDAIPNVFDWDYNMKILDRGAGIVNGRVYAQWRTNGVAFAIREGSYDTTNKTLASGMVFKVEGERLARRGYWGDILVSPYIAYGIECEKEEFFKKANDKYMHSSQDVSEYNVLAMLYELANKEKYVAPDKADEKTTSEPAKLEEITEEEEEEEPASPVIEDVQPPDNPLDLQFEALPVDHAKVHFLPLGCLPDLHKKSRFNKLFDTVYFSNSLVHLLTPDVNQLFADNATVILETAKFMLDLKLEQCKEFADKVTGMAKSAGCQSHAGNDLEAGTHLKFTFKRNS